MLTPYNLRCTHERRDLVREVFDVSATYIEHVCIVTQAVDRMQLKQIEKCLVTGKFKKRWMCSGSLHRIVY
jgi:hypothetical protein